MMKRIVGAGVVVLVAFSAACASEVESTESVGSTSDAVIASSCSGDTIQGIGGPSGCTGSVTITDANVKLNEVRTQAFFSYIMGGPAVPHYLYVGQTQYDLWGSHWAAPVSGASGQATSNLLDTVRSRVAAGAAVTNVGSDTLCSKSIQKFLISDYYAANAASAINVNMKADLNWCFSSASPTFFQIAYDQSSVTIDPEPVTLNAGQTLPAVGTYSSSTNAAATGNNTGAAYAQSSTAGGGVFRWPSGETTAGSTTELATQFAAKPLGVPCFTADQTGTSTSKFIKKGMLAGKYLCVTP